MMAITKQDVWKVANEINKAGDKPTAVEIRKRLGTGSYTTITAALKEWSEPDLGNTDELPELPQEFDERMQQAGADLFALASRGAEERFQEERIAWALVKAEIEQDRAEAIKIADLAEAGMDAMRTELEALRAELEQSKIQQHGLMQLAEERKAEAVKAQEATKSAQEQAYRLAGRVDALEAEIKAERAEAIKIADTAEAEMDAMRAKLDALKAELEQSKIQQHGLMQLAEERKAEAAKAQQATKSAQEQAYRLAGRVDALEQVVSALAPEKGPSRGSPKKPKAASSSSTAESGDAGGAPGRGSVTNEGE